MMMRPRAAASLLALLCIGATAQAEEFTSAKGRFAKEGAVWVEYPAYDGVHHATFSELGRTAKVVALFDPTRDMILRLPLAGGMATWSELDSAEWAGLAEVTHKP